MEFEDIREIEYHFTGSKEIVPYLTTLMNRGEVQFTLEGGMQIFKIVGLTATKIRKRMLSLLIQNKIESYINKHMEFTRDENIVITLPMEINLYTVITTTAYQYDLTSSDILQYAIIDYVENG